MATVNINNIDDAVLSQDERITKYLQGKMSKEEEKVFLNELEADADFKKRAIAIAHLAKGMSNVGKATDKEVADAFRVADIDSDEYGDVVGWMSDGSAGTGQTAVAQGVSSLKFIMNKLVRGETAPYLGMLCRTVTTDDVLGTDRKAGLYVKNVEVDSPAFYAGVQAGDRIISIGQRSVLSNRGLQELFETLSPEQTIGISVGRLNNGEEEIINLSAELGERSQ